MFRFWCWFIDLLDLSCFDVLVLLIVVLWLLALWVWVVFVICFDFG